MPPSRGRAAAAALGGEGHDESRAARHADRAGEAEAEAEEPALPEAFARLQHVDRAAWRAEVMGHEELFLDLHDRLPKELIYERQLLICRMEQRPPRGIAVAQPLGTVCRVDPRGSTPA